MSKNRLSINIKSLDKINIQNVYISRINFEESVKILQYVIKYNKKISVYFPNVYVLTRCKRNQKYRNIINSADLALADGVPLVWASWFLRKYTGGRVSGADFFLEFNRIAETKGYKCFFLGGGPGGSEKVVENFSLQLPGLNIVGNYSPPLGDIEADLNEYIIQKINAVSPNLLWVGLGAPRQETWIHMNLDKLNVNAALGVGAAFDYQAGKKKRAPKWMHTIGMEWSYRILFEKPSLFWRKRYYAYIWQFILPVIWQIVKERGKK